MLFSRSISGALTLDGVVAPESAPWQRKAVASLRRQWPQAVPIAVPVGIGVGFFGMPAEADLNALAGAILQAMQQARIIGGRDLESVSYLAIVRLPTDGAAPSPPRTIIKLKVIISNE